MWSVSLFNFQAMHYKESLFCFSWLKTGRPRWNLFLLFLAVSKCGNLFPQISAIPGVNVPTSWFGEAFSLCKSISITPCLLYSALFFFRALIISVYHIPFICLPTLECESMSTETWSPLLTAPSLHWEKCLEQRQCSLNMQRLQEWGLFWQIL